MGKKNHTIKYILAVPHNLYYYKFYVNNNQEEHAEEKEKFKLYLYSLTTKNRPFIDKNISAFQSFLLDVVKDEVHLLQKDFSKENLLNNPNDLSLNVVLLDIKNQEVVDKNWKKNKIAQDDFIKDLSKLKL